MKKTRIKLAVATVMTAICVNHACAQSASDFDAMWYASAGGTVSGSNGIGLYGPTLVLHSPNKTYQIANFTPPKFSAGCSGIDMMFGSFTMISSQQIEQLVRNIMMAAPGYLMQLAIKAMCDDCSSIMQSMQHIAHMINSGQINACRVAQAAVNSVRQDFGMADSGNNNSKETMESLAANANSAFSDFWGSLNSLFNSGPKSNRSYNDMNSTGYGNTFVNTFYNAGAQNKIDFTLLGGEQQGIQIMMSLLGSDLVPTASQIAATNGSPDANHVQQDVVMKPLLKFQDLVEGASANQRQYYVCGTFVSGDALTCQDPSMPPQVFNYPGLRSYLITLFAGQQDPTSAMGPDGPVITAIQPGSILDSLQQGVPLTAAQASAMQMLPMDLQRMVIELSRSSAYDQVGVYNYAFHLFSESLAANIAYSMVNAINYAYTYNGGGATGITKSIVALKPDQIAALKDLEEVAKTKLSIETRVARFKLLQDMMAQVKEMRTQSATTVQ